MNYQHISILPRYSKNVDCMLEGKYVVIRVDCDNNLWRKISFYSCVFSSSASLAGACVFEMNIVRGSPVAMAYPGVAAGLLFLDGNLRESICQL